LVFKRKREKRKKNESFWVFYIMKIFFDFVFEYTK
jgi:hypothetical protein